MLDLMSNAPKDVAFGARTLRVGALKLRELGLLQRFIRDHSVRPTVAVKEILEFYPPEEHRELMKAAVMADREWPPNVGTREGNTVLFESEDGQRFFLGVMLRKYQPDLSDAFLDEVAAGLSSVDFGVLVSVAFGEDDLDPEQLRAARRKAVVAPVDEEPTSESSTSTSGATPLT